ncbi:MAG: family 78 glycoside hydrolase catalytic domain [Clostridia bacterium]|nr:family 78 glycoside hydrolase catalytic domain [Clostridia bacterium]
MRWIWVNEETEIVNTYAEFRTDFRYSGGKALLDISAADEYAVFVNGVFADCGQYDDYPHYKVFDTLDLAGLCRAGDNELLIRAYYQGVDSFQCVKSAPGVCFALKLDSETVESGPETLARFEPHYMSGPVENVSPQLSFSFRYDARKLPALWTRAFVSDRAVQLLPRPIKKLIIQDPAPGVIKSQGVFLRPDPEAERTPAQAVYADLTAPRRAEGLAEALEPYKTPAYAEAKLPMPGAYRFLPEKGYDGVYLIVDLGRETAGFPTLEVDAREGTVFEIGYGEHLDDGRVRSFVGGRHFGFSYTAKAGRQYFTNWLKRIAGRYMELHVRTDEPFTLYQLSIRSADYPLTVKAAPSFLTDALARRIYDVSVDTLRLCMHEHYEDCPWREQAMYGMDSRNQALTGYWAFGEYDYPAACWALFPPSRRPDGLFGITTPSHTGLTIPSFSLAWVIACRELVEYGGEKYNRFTEPMRDLLKAFLPQLRDGAAVPFEGEDYWNFFEWEDGLAGHLGAAETPIPDAALTLFFYAALKAYAAVCPDDYFASAEGEISAHFHETFWDDTMRAYRTRKGENHYAELVQALALWTGLVPEELAGDLRAKLADPANPFTKVTLSHYIYKLDALMMEPEKYYTCVEKHIMSVWGSMILEGATSFWETIEGGDAFSKAGSLCHGWSAVPVYFWHKYAAYRPKDI